MTGIACVLAVIGTIAAALLILDYRDHRKNKEDDAENKSTFFKDYPEQKE